MVCGSRVEIASLTYMMTEYERSEDSIECGARKMELDSAEYSNLITRSMTIASTASQDI
jgi:hypothetical protein